MRRRVRGSGRARTLSTAMTMAGLLVLGGLAAAAPAAAQSPPSASHQTGDERLIVRLNGTPSRETVAAVAAAAGGRLVAVQPALGMAVVEGPRELKATLQTQPWVKAVAPDASVTLNSLGFDPATQPGSMTKVTQLTGATELWKKGYTGSGIDVALIDTGVAPVPGLSASTKVVVGPDLSFESQSADTRYLDSYGHGTHMAGVIGGREVAAASGSTYAADTTNFYGMAPDSRIVSLKVGDHNGVVDVSQVIAAVDWVAQFGKTNGLNVRVLNLSFGLDSPQDPSVDPLSWAAEVAWTQGIVVVASGGNNGDQTPGLNSPAYNSRILAVGAVDTKGTSSVSDDTIPSFSAVQGGNFPRTPDLVAPGVGIVSLKVPGSAIAESYPTAAIASNFIRGSGTSQAAAVVSGAVALLLQQRPTMTPDQVKALLLNNTTALSNVSSGAQGKGELNLVKASAASVPTTVQSVTASTGNGSLESARGGMHVALDGGQLQGELHLFGQWDTNVAAAKTGNRQMWSSDGSTFYGVAITGAGFTSDTTTWAGRTWSGRTWAGRTWSGNTWTGRTWASCSFTGRTWSGSGWSSGSWSAPITTSSWSGALWSTGGWS